MSGFTLLAMQTPPTKMQHTISFTANCNLTWVTIQQGVQGDAVPLPEREVSSQHPLLFPGPPQAVRERYLNSYIHGIIVRFTGSKNAQDVS